jgi:hypothetical protein
MPRRIASCSTRSVDASILSTLCGPVTETEEPAFRRGNFVRETPIPGTKKRQLKKLLGDPVVTRWKSAFCAVSLDSASGLYPSL